MKICTKCNMEKPESEFAKNSQTSDGLSYWCKSCKKEYYNSKYKKDVEILPKGYKRCGKCKKVKTTDNFNKNCNSKDGLYSICTECQKEYKNNYKTQEKLNITEKCCTKCKQTKAITEFYKNCYSKDGYQTKCKACQDQEYYLNRKEILDKRNLRQVEMNKLPKINVSEKQCNKCKQVLDINNFSINNNSRDGHSYICKDCQKLYDLNRIEQTRQYYINNRDSILQKSKEYKQKHPEVNKRWRCLHSEQLKEYHNVYNNRPDVKERRNKLYREKYSQNINLRISQSISVAIRHSLKGNKNWIHWENIVNYSIEQLKQHLECQFTDDMSWDNYGDYWEIDHIIPINTFNITSMDDLSFKVCWSLANLRPLEKIANRSRPKDGSDISEELKQSILQGVT